MATSEKGNGKYRVKVRLKGCGNRYIQESATFNLKTDAKRWAQYPVITFIIGAYLFMVFL